MPATTIQCQCLRASCGLSIIVDPEEKVIEIRHDFSAYGFNLPMEKLAIVLDEKGMNQLAQALVGQHQTNQW